MIHRAMLEESTKGNVKKPVLEGQRFVIVFFPLALCVTGRAERENQQIFTDTLRQAILDSLYIELCRL